jgi:hypothetical protein
VEDLSPPFSSFPSFEVSSNLNTKVQYYLHILKASKDNEDYHRFIGFKRRFELGELISKQILEQNITFKALIEKENLVTDENEINNSRLMYLRLYEVCNSNFACTQFFLFLGCRKNS